LGLQQKQSQSKSKGNKDKSKGSHQDKDHRQLDEVVVCRGLEQFGGARALVKEIRDDLKILCEEGSKWDRKVDQRIQHKYVNDLSFFILIPKTTCRKFLILMAFLILLYFYYFLFRVVLSA
jgi:hypothetical protein